ncbi:MAG TPA: DUF6056 family protein [Pyrinomonadaceae bacterium]|nr:DUF6056 family protein [Pyrinomonadaceae bacterium]
MSRKVRNSRRIFLWLLLALFCAPLLIHVYLGSYSRFIADDFCSSAVARSQGIFRGAIYWYSNWNGRFSANFLDSLFGYLGPAATPFATGLVITAWLFVLAIAVGQIKRGLLENWIIAAMVLFGLLYVIPQVGQSLYWGQGMRSVVPPLILGTVYVALIAKKSKSTDRAGLLLLITAGLLTFIAVGFAETYFAVQTAAIVFALAIPAVFKIYAPANRRTYFLLLIAGLAGSLAGGLLMFVAPGNKFRQSPFPPPPAVPELLRISMRGLLEFFELVVLAPGKWYIWVGLILSGFIFGLQVFQPREGSGRRDIWTLVWLPVVGFVLLLACWVPMAWGTSLTLGYRTFIIPAYVLVCLVTCWAYLAGQLCRSAFASFTPVVATAVIILLAFGILAANVSREMWQQRSLFAGYARRWDEREQIIERAKTQGLTYAVVPGQSNWAALDEVEVDPKNTWLTKCMHDYYGINVIPELGDLNSEPDGAAKQAALVRQFDAIQKLPGSIPTELNQIYKTDRGKIGFYNSEQSDDQIKSYYDKELARLGWKYIGEKKVEKFGKFSGGSQYLFCNGEVAATLFTTATDEAWLGYTYSLALNWGMSSGYTWGVVDCQGER